MDSPDVANVVKVFDCYEDEEYFYTMLESLKGGDLYDFARNVLHPHLFERSKPQSSPLASIEAVNINSNNSCDSQLSSPQTASTKASLSSGAWSEGLEEMVKEIMLQL